MEEKKGLQILLSYSQAGPDSKAKQGQEEISRNHVPTFFLFSVDDIGCAEDRHNFLRQIMKSQSQGRGLEICFCHERLREMLGARVSE